MRRRRGRGTPSFRRRARSRSAPSSGRRAAARAGPRAAGSPTAKAADTSRRLPSPPPRCATAVGEQEVQRRAAALAGDVLDHTARGCRARRRARASRPRAAPRPSAGGGGTPTRRSRPPTTPSQKACATTNARTERAAARGSREASTLCVIGFGAAFSLVDWPPDADLRVPVPERAHLRALPEDERSARRRAARSAGRAPSRRCCIRSRCITRARGSTRPIMAAARARVLPRTATAASGEKSEGGDKKDAAKDSGSGDKKAAAAD